LKYDLFSTSLLKIHFFHEVMKSGAKWGSLREGARPPWRAKFCSLFHPEGKAETPWKKRRGLKTPFCSTFHYFVKKWIFKSEVGATRII
jgi:hypothetical protein